MISLRVFQFPVRGDECAVAFVDASQHVVKGGGQLPQLIIRLRHCADGVILPLGNQQRSRREIRDRL